MYQLAGQALLHPHTVIVRRGHPTTVDPPYAGGGPGPLSVDDEYGSGVSHLVVLGSP